jgi:Arm DNA-binding domain
LYLLAITLGLPVAVGVPAKTLFRFEGSMSRIKLTMHAIAKLAAPTASGKPVVHWDTDLKGFAVICSGISNSKAYIVQRDLSGGRSRRVTIAKTNEMTLTNAKVRAAKILVEMRDGKDPKAKHAGTLQERGKFCNQDYSTAVQLGCSPR